MRNVSYDEALDEIDANLAILEDADTEDELSKASTIKKAFKLILLNSKDFSLNLDVDQKLNRLMADNLIKSAIQFAEMGFSAGSNRLIAQARQLMNKGG